MAEEQKNTKQDNQPLTKEDEDKLNTLLSPAIDSGVESRIKSVLDPKGIKKIMSEQGEHLRAVEDALLIADRWSPRNKEITEKRDAAGTLIRMPSGNLDSPEEMEKDAVYIASLNTKISLLWSLTKSAINRGEAYLDTLKATAKKVVGEARRAGHLKDKIKTVDQIDSIASTLKKVKDAEKELLDVKEQEEILSSCYFSTQKLGETLAHRAKNVMNERFKLERKN